MIGGLERFREHFRGLTEHFALIGGTACHEQFAQRTLGFRATNDIDMVVLLESLNRNFHDQLRDFIGRGHYRAWRDERPCYYRFLTGDKEFPQKIELFTRTPFDLILSPGQIIVPLGPDDEVSSLSGILMDDDYYSLIQTMRDEVDGLPVVRPEALIPLKALAWLDLTRQKDEGKQVNSKDIRKHRNDVFRLAAIISGERTEGIPVRVQDDMRRFVEMMAAQEQEQAAILAAIEDFMDEVPAMPELFARIRGCYQL